MFVGQHVLITDANDYDFDKVENAAKWKGVFITSLRKVRLTGIFYYSFFFLFDKNKFN